MEMTLTGTGFDEAAAKLGLMDKLTHEHMRRALFRIGGLWKRTSVDYAPISPTTSMLKQFAKNLKRRGEFAHKMYVKGRRGHSGQVVTLTKFYEVRLPMLISKGSKDRPMPGGLMRSITFRNTDTMVECFVPTNSVAGSYAFKIHEEKGSSWKDRGPGTQAKGPQADDKFITRAAADKESDFTAIITSEIDKILEGLK